MHGYLCIYIRIFKVLLCICFIPGVCLRVCVLGSFRTPCYLCTCLCRASGFAQNFNLILSNEKDKKKSVTGEPEELVTARSAELGSAVVKTKTQFESLVVFFVFCSFSFSRVVPITPLI